MDAENFNFAPNFPKVSIFGRKFSDQKMISRKLKFKELRGQLPPAPQLPPLPKLPPSHTIYDSDLKIYETRLSTRLPPLPRR